MKLRKPLLSAAALGSALVLMIGCGSGRLTVERAKEYLHGRYDAEFTCIDETEVTLPTYAPYIFEEGGETHTYSPETDYQLYRFTDSGGVQFELYYDYHYGCMGVSHSMTDNYCSRWLIAQPEVYEPLADSEYGFVIESSEDGKKDDLVLYIEDFKYVKPAAELAYSVIMDDRAILPDRGTEQNEVTTISLNPYIILKAKNGAEIASLSFRSRMHPTPTDIDVFSRLAEDSYIELVKSRELDAQLTTAVRNREDSTVMNIYSGDKRLDAVLMRNYTHDLRTSEYIGEDNVDTLFRGVAEICEAAGWRVKHSMKRKMVIEKGGTKVVIERKDLKNKNELNTGLNITLNGERYYPEGEATEYFDGYSLELTTADYYALFGIDFDFDFDSGNAYIR